MWGLLRRTQRSMWKDRGRVSVVGVGSVLKTIDRVGGLKLIPGSVRVFGGSNWTGTIMHRGPATGKEMCQNETVNMIHLRFVKTSALRGRMFPVKLMTDSWCRVFG